MIDVSSVPEEKIVIDILPKRPAVAKDFDELQRLRTMQREDEDRAQRRMAEWLDRLNQQIDRMDK